MKKLNLFSLILIMALTVWSCSDGGSSTGPDPGSEPGPGTQPGEVTAEKQFVYNAMNEWYYWQTDVPDLADDRFSSDEAKDEFLMGFSDAEELFFDLHFIEDDFSFFIDDYEEFENNQDGIFAALGFNYGFIGFQNSNDIIGFVRYVIPNSPADDANLERFDLFTKVDGTDLTSSNFVGILTSNSSHTLTMAEIESSNQGVSFPETGETVTVQSEEVVENPIFLSTVIDTNSTKIGYMLYNAFQGNSHENLNNAFADFQAQGVSELVLDLRYNGGGLVLTSQLLASLVSGRGSSDTFARFDYNEKHPNLSRDISFLDEVPIQDAQGDFSNSAPINSLSLNKLYVLTSQGTASASEALINGLEPYIDVTVIGLQTVGKDEGSLTLYDAAPDYTNKDNINPNHKNAIQPIVTKIVNSEGADYPEGLVPDFEQSEITVENIQNNTAIGDPDDPLLGQAVSLILGEPMAEKPSVVSQSFLRNIKVILDVSDERKQNGRMYIGPSIKPLIDKK